MHHLNAYGWNYHFASLLTAGERLDQVARVIQEHKEAYLVHAAMSATADVHTPGRNIWAEISGKLRHAAAIRADFPAVGDWVILRGLQHAGTHSGPVHITRILPRRTVLSRRLEANPKAGESSSVSGDDHLLAVNVDIAFLGTSLNESFNLRRLERYLNLALRAGVRPVVLITKADLCPDPSPCIEQARAIAPPGTPIHAVSALSGQGMDELNPYLAPGATAVILGSSGVGKSTLVNHLAQSDIQDMMQTRDFDDKGRHCTTFRHLIRTPTGGLIIDTPGLRGLALGESADDRLNTFEDVESLVSACRFTDCRHDTEPGCAVKSALDAGTLDPARLEGYLKLQRERAALARRENRLENRKQKKLEKKATADFNRKSRHKWDHH